jgi:hypothetical protein
VTIDGTKTEVMKFRNRWNLARYNYFTCRKDRLEVVSWFKYLGITLKTSGISFTQHIYDRVAAAI